MCFDHKGERTLPVQSHFLSVVRMASQLHMVLTYIITHVAETQAHAREAQKTFRWENLDRQTAKLTPRHPCFRCSHFR